MRIPLLLLSALLSSCSTSPSDTEYWTSTAARYTDSQLSRSLSGLLRRIEMGDNLAWNEFAEIRHGLDGEKSQTYAVACAELLRRDPTFFLRKYLKKDTKALEPGKLAYRWSDPKGRILYDEVYARRLYIATDAKERKRIGVFIDYTTSKR